MNQSLHFRLINSQDPFWGSLKEFNLFEDCTLADVLALQGVDLIAAKQAVITGLESLRLKVIYQNLELTTRSNATQLFRPASSTEDLPWSQNVVIGHREEKWTYHHTLHGWTIRTELSPDQILIHREQLQAWEFLSSQKSHDDHFGQAQQLESDLPDGQYIKHEVIPGASKYFPALTSPVLPLDRASQKSWDKTWLEIHKTRHSRITQKRALQITDWGSLLDLTLAKHNQHYAYPSAGSFYELLAFIHFENGLYFYHPENHTLQLMAEAPIATESVIYLAGPMTSLTKKYKRIPYRLMLLNTGVLYQQFSLAVALLGIEGHANGGGAPRWVERTIQRVCPDIKYVVGSYTFSGRTT